MFGPASGLPLLPPPIPNLSVIESVVDSVLHEGFVYRTLHDHPVDSTAFINEAGKFRKLNDGWEVCRADADSVKICAQHAWGAHLLVFADGSTYATASGPQYDYAYIPGALLFHVHTC